MHRGVFAFSARDSSTVPPPLVQGCSTETCCRVRGPCARHSKEKYRGDTSVNAPQGDCLRKMAPVSSDEDRAQTFNVYWTK